MPSHTARHKTTQKANKQQEKERQEKQEGLSFPGHSLVSTRQKSRQLSTKQQVERSRGRLALLLLLFRNRTAKTEQRRRQDEENFRRSRCRLGAHGINGCQWN
jgi:hypothetical protein